MSTTRQERSAETCARVREWLPEYDYGGPGFWARLQARRHLEHCSGCAAELAELRRATDLLAEMPRERAPGGMWERLEGAIAMSERPATVRRRSPGRMAALAAAGACALAASVGLWNGRHQPVEPVAVATPTSSLVRSHLALSRGNPFTPGAGLDVILVRSAD